MANDQLAGFEAQLHVALDNMPGALVYTDEQLNIINPKMVVTLGRYSMARYFPGQSISRIHGRAVEREGLTVIPMFHPAAALHQQSFRGMIEEDFKKLGALIADMRREPDPEPEPEPQQLSMF